jgi:hypothetical protein
MQRGGSRPFKGDAHAFLMMVYKDPSLPLALRLDAAKAAITFEKPALVATYSCSRAVDLGSAAAKFPQFPAA